MDGVGSPSSSKQGRRAQHTHQLSQSIIIGDSRLNKDFPSNSFQTARYTTTWSLITLGSLWLIFKSTSSIYFFIVSLFQLLTPFSPTGRFSTMGPYLGNKVIELFLLYQDNKKKILTDWNINNRAVRVLSESNSRTERNRLGKSIGWSREKRQSLKVGDILLLDSYEAWRGEDVPVDLLILYSKTRDVYVNQASLTGEQNPVQKRVPDGLDLKFPLSTGFYGLLYVTEPNSDLDYWVAELHIGTDVYYCNSDNLILAGSEIMKGSDVYGVVVATGSNTKINLKKQIRSEKIGYLDEVINRITKFNLVLLFAFVCLGTLGYLSSHKETDYSMFQVVLIYFLIFNGLISMTLNFSLEMVRRVQALAVTEKFMGGVEVSNWSAPEQLGLVEAIVFDKTGTLTENKLIPLKMMIPHKGTVYNLTSNLSFNTSAISLHIGPEDEDDADPLLPEAFEGGSSGNNSGSNNDNNSGDEYKEFNLTWKAAKKDEDLHFFLLGVCLNSSVARQPEATTISYFGTSIDEVSILTSIYNVAKYYIVDRPTTLTGEQMLIHTCYGTVTFDLLFTAPYSSARGKITVIVQNTNDKKIYVITKGSPSKLIPALQKSLQPAANESVTKLAQHGLRVIIYVCKEVSAVWSGNIGEKISFYKRRGDTASINVLIDTVLETEMNLMGVTGTEDKLVPGVKEKIETLQEYGILTMVCTGDIKITARNVGENIGILPRFDEGKVFDLEVDSDEQRQNLFSGGSEANFETKLEAVLDYKTKNPETKIGILLGKNELNHMIQSEHSIRMFIRLLLLHSTPNTPSSSNSSSSNSAKTSEEKDIPPTGVVVFRAGPQEKLKLTQLLQRQGNLLVGCCGDGANDIEMIEESHIGIGILSGENTHAAASADISVRKVTDLVELIKTFGSLNWERNSQLAVFISSMKLTVIMGLFLWAFIFTNFSTFPLFTGKMLLSFNFFYGWGVIVYSLKMIRSQSSLKTANFDEVGIKRLAWWWARACLDAILILIYAVYHFNSFRDTSHVVRYWGDDTTLAQYSVFVFMLLWVNLKVSVESGIGFNLGAKWVHLVVFGTMDVVSMFCVLPVWNQLEEGWVLWMVGGLLGLVAVNVVMDFVAKKAWDIVEGGKKGKSKREVRKSGGEKQGRMLKKEWSWLITEEGVSLMDEGRKRK